MKIVTIHSDIDGNSVKVINEDGNVLEGVASVMLTLEAGNINQAEIVLRGACVNVKAHLQEISIECPNCSQVLDHKCE